MKKIIFTFSLLLVALACIGCASKPVVEAEENQTPPEVKSSYTKREYLDWQYKGFGKELPDWIEKGNDGSLTEVKKIFPELEDKEVIIFSCYAENRDQADALFKGFLKLEINDSENEDLEQNPVTNIAPKSEKKSSKRDDDYVKPEVVHPEDENKVFDLNGDIYSVKEKIWVHVKESYFTSEDILEKEETTYKVFAILVREDTGL